MSIEEQTTSYLRTLNGEVQEIDGQIVLLCDEFPISGIGNTPEEAFTNLLGAFAAYEEAARVIGHPIQPSSVEKRPGTFQLSYAPEREYAHVVSV